VTAGATVGTDVVDPDVPGPDAAAGPGPASATGAADSAATVTETAPAADPTCPTDATDPADPTDPTDDVSDRADGAAGTPGSSAPADPGPADVPAGPAGTPGSTPGVPAEAAPTTDLVTGAAATADAGPDPDLAPAAPGVERAGPKVRAPDIEGRIVQVRPESTRSVVPAGYTPPPSPAYAPRPEPVVSRYARATVERRAASPETVPDAADAGTSPRAWQGHQGRRLLGVGLALVLVALAVALVTTVRGGGNKTYEFGQVTAVSGAATVRTGDGDSSARPIEQGDTVRAGWVIEAPGDAATTVSLSDGGVVRLAGGGRLTFTDLADAPPADGATGPPEPAIVVEGGRAWINPGGPGGAAAADLQVQIPDAVVTSTGNPVALDCTAACTVEAPAGGASLSTAGDADMTPAAGETVTFQPPDHFDLAVGDGPSGWAQQNLDADAAAGLPEPRPDDTPGIRDSAVVDGTYSIVIGVVGPPAGDDIPSALQYSEGETYTLDLVTDGSTCTSGSCTVPVTAIDAATGTVDISGGSLSLDLVQPIDCYDETYTTVAVPGIGTTEVEATMTVDEVSHDGTRWRVRTFTGTGAVAATLTTRCNPGDVLGTATSAITIAGS
jgi:hypothetical protein